MHGSFNRSRYSWRQCAPSNYVVPPAGAHESAPPPGTNRSIQLFSRGSHCLTHTHTHIDTQTTERATFVAVGRVYATAMHAMRPYRGGSRFLKSGEARCSRRRRRRGGGEWGGVSPYPADYRGCGGASYINLPHRGPGQSPVLNCIW